MEVAEQCFINVSKKQHECSYCLKSFSAVSRLNEHIRTHTGERPYKCSECSKAFSYKSNLRHHMRTHTGERPFQCNVCGKRFLHKNACKEHYFIHTGERRFVCELCQKSFFQKSLLNEHYRTHTGERPFVCDICQKTFMRRNCLKLHYAFVHTDNREQHVCDICKKSYSSKPGLRNHLRTHSEEPKFQCDLCPKAYYDRCYLIEHLGTHTRPFYCYICKKSFSRKFCLTKHNKLVHKPAEISKCRYCRRKIEGSLKYHYRVGHPMLKPFKCKICNKSFFMIKLLKRHLKRSHINIDDHESLTYACIICQKMFSDKTSLDNHIKAHSRENFYLSNVCNKSIMRSGILNMHLPSCNEEKKYQCIDSHQAFSVERSLKNNSPVNESELHSWEKYHNNFWFQIDFVKQCQRSIEGYVDGCTYRLHEEAFPQENLKAFKTFLPQEQLKSHFQSHHSDKSVDKPFECIDCYKRFFEVQDLKSHFLLHKQKPFSCSKCGRRFFQKTSLAVHFLNHWKKETYMCKICHESFPCRRLLSWHLTFHDNVSLYTCDQCRKPFLHKRYLTTHLKGCSERNVYQANISVEATLGNDMSLKKNSVAKSFLELNFQPSLLSTNQHSAELSSSRSTHIGNSNKVKSFLEWGRHQSSLHSLLSNSSNLSKE